MILRNIAFTIPRDKVLLRLKFNKTVTKVPKNINRLIDEMMDEGYALVNAQASTKNIVIKMVLGSTTCFHETDFVAKGKAITEHLRDCYKVTLMLATIGSDYARKVNEFLKTREITKAAVLDAVVSEAVEAVAEAVTSIIAQDAQLEDATITSRFSPGYGDWPLEAQKDIFEMLNAKEISVKLSDACLMMPEKSISACVGWKKEEDKPVRKILRKKNEK